MMKEDMKKDGRAAARAIGVIDAKGEGPGDLFGLGGKPGGRGLLGGGGRYVPYASMFQAQIAEVLRSASQTQIRGVSHPDRRSGRIDRPDQPGGDRLDRRQGGRRRDASGAGRSEAARAAAEGNADADQHIG